MRNFKIKFAAFLMAVVLPLSAAIPTWVKTPENVADLLAIQKQVQSVLKKCMAATVTLQMGGSSGSGVVVNKDGLVLTAGHVSGTPGRSVTVILNDGRRLKGKALGMHKGSDSGMVRITNPPDDLPIVDFDKSKDKLPKMGQWCIAVGNPGGLDKERGVVVRVGRVIKSTRTTVRTDCMLLGGDSGGPLFDFNGVVIGIHSRISGAPDSNMHVAMTAFQDEWEGLIDPSSKLPAYLGVYTENNESGALVLEVRDNSPAKKGDIQKGDILQKVNDKDIKDAFGLTEIIRAFRPGTKVKIALLREGKKKIIEVNLGSRK